MDKVLATDLRVTVQKMQTQACRIHKCLLEALPIAQP
jgi:hypothetical protein